MKRVETTKQVIRDGVGGEQSVFLSRSNVWENGCVTGTTFHLTVGSMKTEVSVCDMAALREAVGAMMGEDS